MQLRILCLLAGWAMTTLAAAASFNVNPVRVDLASQVRSRTVQVQSQVKEPLLVKAQLLRWRKVNGVNVTEPATGIIVTPPVFKLAPQGTQILRVGLLGKPGALPMEGSYRLLVTELPVDVRAEKPATDDKTLKIEIKTLLTMDIPVFVRPANVVLAQDFAASAGEGELLALTVNNGGTVHQKISGLEVRDANGVLLNKKVNFFYSLPGQQSRESLALIRAVGAGELLRLRYEFDYRIYEVNLTTGGPAVAVAEVVSTP